MKIFEVGDIVILSNKGRAMLSSGFISGYQGFLTVVEHKTMGHPVVYRNDVNYMDATDHNFQLAINEFEYEYV